MIFSSQNQRSYVGALVQNTKPNPGVVRPIPFSILSGNRFQTLPKLSAQATTTLSRFTEPPPPPPPPKKMKWGEPIWTLFHVLAEKVREDIFPTIRLELLNIIFTICLNLPCPDCANHAVLYLNDIHYKNIQTKEQLKNMLYTFHNTVNTKKGFPLFPREQLEITYANYKLNPVLQRFMMVFQDKHKSIRMIADDFHRSEVAIDLKKWFNKYILAFSS